MSWQYNQFIGANLNYSTETTTPTNDRTTPISISDIIRQTNDGSNYNLSANLNSINQQQQQASFNLESPVKETVMADQSKFIQQTISTTTNPLTDSNKQRQDNDFFSKFVHHSSQGDQIHHLNTEDLYTKKIGMTSTPSCGIVPQSMRTTPSTSTSTSIIDCVVPHNNHQLSTSQWSSNAYSIASQPAYTAFNSSNLNSNQQNDLIGTSSQINSNSKTYPSPFSSINTLGSDTSKMILNELSESNNNLMIALSEQQTNNTSDIFSTKTGNIQHAHKFVANNNDDDHHHHHHDSGETKFSTKTYSSVLHDSSNDTPTLSARYLPYSGGADILQQHANDDEFMMYFGNQTSFVAPSSSQNIESQHRQTSHINQSNALQMGTYQQFQPIRRHQQQQLDNNSADINYVYPNQRSSHRVCNATTSSGGERSTSLLARAAATTNFSTNSTSLNAKRGDKTFCSSVLSTSGATSVGGNSSSKQRRNKLPIFPITSGFMGDGHHGQKLNAYGVALDDTDSLERFSRKVFVGGLPPDIDEEEIKSSFRRFGSLTVDWPHKLESKSYFPPKGYAFLLFQEEASVQALIDACLQDDDKLYLCVSSPTIKDKPVQIRPWRISDADFVLDSTLALDPRKTVFVGGVPRPLKASELAKIMDSLYGAVCYAGIDTDPDLKYPKGAGRVAFSDHSSYIAAISARFVHIRHCDIEKRVEVKPYVLDDQFCDECQGSRCNNKFAPFFCANISCLRYYCDNCWSIVHSESGKEYHKPLIKEGGDRPRGSQNFRW